MKLLTHNMLRCNIKGIKNGYPLIIKANKIEIHKTELNKEFLHKMIVRLDWNAFREAVNMLTQDEFPSIISDDLKEDEKFLEKFHHNLLEVIVVEGLLICPESGRQFPITNSIPNMILNEDEI